MTKFCIQKDVIAEVMAMEEDEDINTTMGGQNKTGNVTMNTTDKAKKKELDRLLLERQKRSSIEEFILFDIDKNNSTPNKEN